MNRLIPPSITIKSLTKLPSKPLIKTSIKRIVLSFLCLLFLCLTDISVFAKKKSRGGKSHNTSISKFHSKKKKPKKVTGAVKPHSAKYAAIVMDADSGVVLHAESADAKRFPASCTKMMTLYIAFEALERGLISFDTVMEVSKEASIAEPTKLYLKEGETITVKAAILGLITKSANDASVVLAEHLAGSVESFARQMTRKARSLGMSRTVFKNPHGLPNPEQITSARDLAILSRALYKNFPQYYKYFSTLHFTHKGVKHRNHNHLLGRVPGVDGIKTGLTNASGYNLAASAVRYDEDNTPRRLITVVMGGPNRHWRDRRVEQLFETYFPRVGIQTSHHKEGSSEKNKIVKTSGQKNSDSLTDLIYETSQEDENGMTPLSNVVTDDDDEDEDEKEEKKSAFRSSSDPLNGLLNDVDWEERKPSVQSSRARFTKLKSSVSGSVPKVIPAKWVVPTPSPVSQTSLKKPSRKKQRSSTTLAVKKERVKKVVPKKVALKKGKGSKKGSPRVKKVREV